MASESSGGGGGRPALGSTTKGGRFKANPKAGKVKGTQAGIPFKSGFRTASGQKAFKTRGGRNTAAPGTLRGAAKKGKAKGKKGK